MWRLISRRSGPAQHDELLAVLPVQIGADGMPEVGVYRILSFDLLSRAGDVDRRGDQLIRRIPATEDFDTVVFVTFEAGKRRHRGRSIQLGPAVPRNRQPILRDHGVTQAPADASWPAGLPGRSIASTTRSIRNCE